MVELFWAFFFFPWTYMNRLSVTSLISRKKLTCSGMQLQGHSFTAATRNGKGIILNSGFHMLYGNLSEKKKFFMNCKENGQAFRVTIASMTCWGEWGRAQVWTIPMSILKRKGQTESSNPVLLQKLRRGKGWFFWAFWHPTNYLFFPNHLVLLIV